MQNFFSIPLFPLNSIAWFTLNFLLAHKFFLIAIKYLTILKSVVSRLTWILACIQNPIHITGVAWSEIENFNPPFKIDA